MPDKLLEVKHLKKYFNTKNGLLHAVDDVSFDIERGETLGLVGESGCGKSTIGRAILRLHEPTSGEVLLNGVDVTKLNKQELRALRQKMQIVFQDPYSSLDGRKSVFESIGVPSAIVRRKFISTGNWAECLDILFSIRHMAPMNFLVSNGNLHGDMMCIEAGANGAQILYPENGLTYHTNHFLSQGHLLYGRKGSSVNRYNTIKRLLSGKEKIGIEDMISVLNCTFGAPESVLNQRNSRDKEIEQCATLACFIIDATERRFWVRKGNIRENPFVEYKWSRPDKIYAEWR